VTPIGAYTKAISDRLAQAITDGLVIHDSVLGDIPVGQILSGIPVLIEDASELLTSIQTQIDQVGMLILIGMPTGQDTGQSVAIANDKIISAIAIGENPTIWRDDPLTKPVCLDVVYAVKAAIQGLIVPGFAQRLHVPRFDFFPHETRQLYEVTIESRLITDAVS
jgi:hypothetical protein